LPSTHLVGVVAVRPPSKNERRRRPAWTTGTNLSVFDQFLMYVVPPRWVGTNALQLTLGLCTAPNITIPRHRPALIGLPVQIDCLRKPVLAPEMVRYVAGRDLAGALGAFDLHRK